MKTTRFFIALSAIISILLFAFGFYDGGVYFIFVTACIFILNSALKKNAQLTSNLNDAERDARYWKERFGLGNMWSKKDAEYIQELSAELETAKANSYTEIERKRGREKYNRLYKGKKKAKQQPYTIEGKTIKELVEENLGIEVVSNIGRIGYLCGFENEKKINNVDIFIVGFKEKMVFNFDNEPFTTIIDKSYCNHNWASSEDVINAIKKHRNIQ